MAGLGLLRALRSACAPSLYAPRSPWTLHMPPQQIGNIPTRGKKKVSYRKRQWVREKWRRKWIGTKTELDLDAQRAATIRRDLTSAFGSHSTSANIDGGDMVMGRVVATSNKKFRVVDFGLKKEVSFPPDELVGARDLGDQVAYPLIRPEDEFREPELDYSRATALPPVQAARTLLLSKLEKGTGSQKIVRGRVVGPIRAGYIVRALGHDFFLPSTLTLGLPDPMIGRYFNFLVMKVESFVYQQQSRGVSQSGVPLSTGKPTSESNIPYNVVFAGVVSAYAAVVPTLANLVGRDNAWEASGGGTNQERLAYLRLLTRLVYKKNPHVRKQMTSRPDVNEHASANRVFTYDMNQLGEALSKEPLDPSRNVDRPTDSSRSFNR